MRKANKNMRVKTTIPISEARRRIFDIAEEVQKPNNYYTFTEKGRPKAVLVSADEFESIMETMEILSDPELMTDIKNAEKEYKNGEYMTWKDIKKDLGLRNYEKEAVMVCEKPKRKYRASRK